MYTNELIEKLKLYSNVEVRTAVASQGYPTFELKKEPINEVKVVENGIMLQHSGMYKDVLVIRL